MKRSKPMSSSHIFFFTLAMWSTCLLLIHRPWNNTNTWTEQDSTGLIYNKILILKIRFKKKQTSMHSSRMRTARLLPVSPSIHCAGGCLLPGECLVLGGMSASGPGGVSASGPGGGVCLWSQGVGCLPLVRGGSYPSMHWGRHPPVNRMTDTGVKT